MNSVFLTGKAKAKAFENQKVPSAPPLLCLPEEFKMRQQTEGLPESSDKRDIIKKRSVIPNCNTFKAWILVAPSSCMCLYNSTLVHRFIYLEHSLVNWEGVYECVWRGQGAGVRWVPEVQRGDTTCLRPQGVSLVGLWDLQ